MNSEILDRPVREASVAHVALAIVVDVSASMSGAKIQSLNTAVNDLILQIQKDSRLKDIVDLGIFAFGEKGKEPIHQGFRAVSDCTRISLAAEDRSTYITSALDKAVEMLRTRCGVYSRGGGAYKPWIVVITDGEFHDSPAELNAAAARLKKRESEGKLQVFCLGVDGYNRSQLEQLTNNNQHVLDIDIRNVTEFLSWIGKSFAIISSKEIDAEVELPTLRMTSYNFSL